jgi:hypothetical protein
MFNENVPEVEVTDQPLYVGAEFAPLDINVLAVTSRECVRTTSTTVVESAGPNSKNELSGAHMKSLTPSKRNKSRSTTTTVGPDSALVMFQVCPVVVIQELCEQPVAYSDPTRVSASPERTSILCTFPLKIPLEPTVSSVLVSVIVREGERD